MKLNKGEMKMCEYCEENKALSYDLDGYESRIYCCKGNLKYSCGDEEYDFTLKINYCPMCGKKL